MDRAGIFTLGCALALCFSTEGTAASILVGSNGGPPNDQIEIVLPGGTVTSLIGPSGASAAALDAAGNLFFAIPGDNSSTIQEYSPSMALLKSFDFTAPADMQPFGSYITDLGWGISSLWASTFTGMVYRLSDTGTVQSSFATGATSPGVTIAGSSVYTTAGQAGPQSASPFLYQRDTFGNILNTIDTGLNDTLGVGFDASTNNFWIGGFDVLSEVTSQGSVVQQFALEGEHTGVDVALAAPEPGTILLAGLGLLGLIGRKLRRS
jgi:PEP-CTERM motif